MLADFILHQFWHYRISTFFVGLIIVSLSLSLMVTFITLSDSMFVGSNRVNGFHKFNALSRNTLLFLYGGLLIITSRFSGS